MDNNNQSKKAGKPKGLPKTGGRKPGSVNKKSYWLRDALESVNLNWPEEFKKAFDSLDYKRAELLASLLPYLNPKIAEKDIDANDEDKAIATVNYTVKGSDSER